MVELYIKIGTICCTGIKHSAFCADMYKLEFVFLCSKSLNKKIYEKKPKTFWLLFLEIKNLDFPQ